MAFLGARAGAHDGLGWPFSLMCTGGAISGGGPAPQPVLIPFSPAVSSCFFAPPNEKNERRGGAPYRAR